MPLVFEIEWIVLHEQSWSESVTIKELKTSTRKVFRQYTYILSIYLYALDIYFIETINSGLFIYDV